MFCVTPGLGDCLQLSLILPLTVGTAFSFLGAAGRYETVLRRFGSSDSHVIPLRLEGERFRIEADVDRMPFFGSAIPLRDVGKIAN